MFHFVFSSRRNNLHSYRRIRPAPERLPAEAEIRPDVTLQLSVPVPEPYRGGVQPAVPLAPAHAGQLHDRWDGVQLLAVLIQHLHSYSLRRGETSPGVLVSARGPGEFIMEDISSGLRSTLTLGALKRTKSV